MRDLGMDVRNPLLDLLGPQTQGSHAAFKIQVSQSMNYGNGARNRVFDPQDVIPLRVFEGLRTNTLA